MHLLKYGVLDCFHVSALSGMEEMLRFAFHFSEYSSSGVTSQQAFDSLTYQEPRWKDRFALFPYKESISNFSIRCNRMKDTHTLFPPISPSAATFSQNLHLRVGDNSKSNAPASSSMRRTGTNGRSPISFGPRAMTGSTLRMSF